MATVFNETIFVKEDSVMEKAIETFGTRLNDYNNLKKGVYGEQQVAYHLSKANMGMFVLRDVHLEFGDMTAQIDFIVVTSHHCYFVECKNYNGNIEIDETGNFVLNTNPGKRGGRKGIKSPIGQVQDQLEVFKKIALDNTEKMKTLMNGVRFKDYFKTIVVFTNSENIIKNAKAPIDIKYRVLKVDNLLRQIEYDNKKYEGNRLNKNDMNEIAKFFLEINKEKDINTKDIKTDMNMDLIQEKGDSNEEENHINKFLSGCAIALVGMFVLYIILNVLLYILESLY